MEKWGFGSQDAGMFFFPALQQNRRAGARQVSVWDGVWLLTRRWGHVSAWVWGLTHCRQAGEGVLKAKITELARPCADPHGRNTVFHQN